MIIDVPSAMAKLLVAVAVDLGAEPGPAFMEAWRLLYTVHKHDAPSEENSLLLVREIKEWASQ